MKANCKAAKLSIIISSIALILSILAELIDIKYANAFTEYINNLFLGVFCSSIVTIFFYVSAYKVEKRRVLEQYWNECRKLLLELNKIEYMNIEYDEDLFIEFINEQQNKKWKQQFYKNISKKIPKENFKNTNLIKESIVIDNKEIYNQLSESGKRKYLEDEVEKLYKRSIDTMEKIVIQYLNYLDYSTDGMNNILGDIEFFTGKKNYIKAYELFKNIFDLRNRIFLASIHFREYIKGEGNKAIVMKEILNLQKNIFRVEKRKNSKIIYRKFDDLMQEKLEEFRAKVIYNIDPIYQKTIPFMQSTRIEEK